jgi:hypothetical protein
MPTFAVPIWLSRHYYDVFRLLASEHGNTALADLKLAESCAKHARLYFDRRPLDLNQATPGTFGIVPADGMLEPLKADYEKMVGMIFGDVPSFEDIIGKIKTAEATLNAVWPSSPHPFTAYERGPPTAWPTAHRGDRRRDPAVTTATSLFRRRRSDEQHQTGAAISKYRQNALASCICLGVRHSASKTRGEATITQMHFARDVATFRRLAL